MTRSFSEFTDVVEDWLGTAPAFEDSERLLGSIIAELDATPQQRWPWEPLRKPAFRLLIAFATGATATLVAIVVGAQMLGWPRAADPPARDAGAFGADGGDVAFVRATYVAPGGEVQNVGIFVASSSGGDPRLIATPPGETWSRPRGSFPNDPRNDELVGPAVSWSPDSSRIAFRLFNDQPGIYVMNSDGTDLRRVVDLPLDRNSGMGMSAALDWLPDGTQISYTYPYSRIWSPLYLVDIADGTVRNLTGSGPASGASRTVAWSPDGSMAAFVRTDQGMLPRGSRLLVINADGSGMRELPIGPEPSPQVLGIAWSPDGSMIAFSLQMGDASDPAPHRSVMRVTNADGTGLRDLVEPVEMGACCTWTSVDEPLEWSPDGSTIATIGSGPDGRAVVLVKADGSGERRVTDAGDFSWFDWSPDGSELVVYDQNTYSIQVVEIDSMERRWIANGEFPAWAPATSGR